MNHFAKISNDLILNCFDKIRQLYIQDEVKILLAAERVTAGENRPFIKTSGQIHPQTEVLKDRIKRITDKYGQLLLFKLIEELFADLTSTGAIGVSTENFLAASKILQNDNSIIKYSANNQWKISWELESDGNKRNIELGLYGKLLPKKIIVQEYILQYIQQAMNAFKQQRPAAALSLMTIALEGTLRDALKEKGYTYQYGTPAHDIYRLELINVHKDSSGYKVTFPSTMPLDHNHFLSGTGDPASKTFRIKRVTRDRRTFLEIRDAADLLDYWSSDVVETPGSISISGLGAALDISRNRASFLLQTDLPDDLDAALQAVRNNLIHLSGDAMLEEVDTDSEGNPVLLEAFLKNENRVFDAICSIGEAINKIYQRIADDRL